MTTKFESIHLGIPAVLEEKKVYYFFENGIFYLQNLYGCGFPFWYFCITCLFFETFHIFFFFAQGSGSSFFGLYYFVFLVQPIFLAVFVFLPSHFLENL